MTQEQQQASTGDTIAEAEFWDRYKPVEVEGQEGTYLRPYDDVKDRDIHHVWTVVEGDDGEWYIEAGFHVVNKIDYMVTENPWETGLESGYYNDPDDFPENREEEAEMDDDGD